MTTTNASKSSPFTLYRSKVLAFSFIYAPNEKAPLYQAEADTDSYRMIEETRRSDHEAAKTGVNPCHLPRC